MTGTGSWQPAGTPAPRARLALAEEEEMALTYWHKQEPRLAAPAGVPARVRPLRPLASPPPVLPVPAPPAAPSWTHRMLPATARHALAGLGLWQNPVPLRPSAHLQQVLDTLRKYGWCKSLDVSPTGRMCIRGAQQLLEKTGHVTPAARDRAVAYMQEVLHQSGVVMQFFAWNDIQQDFAPVEKLLVKAAYLARANGE